MLSATGKQNSSFLLDGIKDLSVGKENYAWGEPCKKNISEVDSIDHNLLRECKTRNQRRLRRLRRIQKLQAVDPAYPVCASKITSNDVDRMVSEFFATLCGEYYERCMKLDELIASDIPRSERFMEIMNAGPMYIQDYCRFVTSYRNKFKRPLLINNTALSDVIIIRNLNWPPRDIYGQRALMDVASARHYVVARGVKATEALSALKNTFCIIECSVAYQIAYYETILAIVGKEIFNERFDRDAELPLDVSVNAKLNIIRSVDPFLSWSERPRNDDNKPKYLPPLTVKKGHVYYFSNHKDYVKKHPIGEHSGLNVMLVNIIDECPYFTGFGLPKEGLKAQDIICKLVDRFNCSTEDDFQGLYHDVSPSAKEQADRLKEKTITTEEFYANGAGWSYLGRGSHLALPIIMLLSNRRMLSILALM